MCGRDTLRRDLHTAARELGAEGMGGTVIFNPRYNIAPTQQTPILTNEAECGRQLSPMVWGIPGKGVRHINARAETLQSRPLWRWALQQGRCAVVADGFYEWSGAKGSKRQPYFFRRPDDGLILMAGLWQWHQDEVGYLQTFAIVTTPANATVAPVHERMPAILEGSLWLNPQLVARELPGVLVPARDELLQCRAVSMAVNDAKNDRPSCCARP